MLTFKADQLSDLSSHMCMGTGAGIRYQQTAGDRTISLFSTQTFTAFKKFWNWDKWLIYFYYYKGEASAKNWVK